MRSAGGTWFDLAQISIGLLIIFLTVVTVGYALFLLILSKFAIAIILAIGAMFLVLYLFNTTRTLFSSWVNSLFNYALIPILTFSLLHLMLRIMKSYTDELAVAAASGKMTFADVPGFFLFGVITLVVLMQVPNMAAGLAGGLGLTTAGAPMAMAAGGYLSSRWAAKGAAKLGGKAHAWYRSRRGKPGGNSGGKK